LSESLLPKDAAAAYDDILTATQDAVDATKHAIDELKGEGVQQSDRRMQSLQITRTAVTYEMISWRIGRNRVLMGEQDGATQDTALLSKRQLKRAQKQTENRKEEAPGRRIARLKEKVVLYDGTLQSLESVQELPGVAADEELSAQLEATSNYFEALK
jgi:signal recognition particle subunit SRP68